ncbi:MAG TPA: hypothetical protein ENM97_07730 [Moorella mulderi]|nr:hypothetical protein [Moorella mulderi]
MSPIFSELGLTLALVAAVAYGAFKLHIPSIPFLICLGLILSPKAPLLLPVDYRLHGSFPAFILLGQFGLLCLLFTLGLEFSLGHLLRAGRRILVSGLAYTAVHWSYGILAAWVWGWRGLAVIVNGAIVAISSSAIIAKVLVDLRREPPGLKRR